ncbi:hypothetical protein [Nitrospira sp. M1]
MTFTFSMLYVASAAAVPMGIEAADIEQATSPETPSAHDNLSEIPLAAQSVSLEPVKDFDLEPSSLHTAAKFFRTLLSSLTYEVKFTPLGRLYTAIPEALHSQDHPLLSFRLLPHPDMPQSTALVNNKHFVIDQSTKAVSPKQETNRLNTAFLFVIIFFVLTGAAVAILWQTRTIIILRI